VCTGKFNTSLEFHTAVLHGPNSNAHLGMERMESKVNSYLVSALQQGPDVSILIKLLGEPNKRLFCQ
jgi:hypothetical protein